jgi:hypothetical protein
MNTEYVWWLLALLLAGGGMVGFLALGRVPEIEDERPAAGEPQPDATDDPSTDQSPPLSTTVPGAEDPPATSDTP